MMQSIHACVIILCGLNSLHREMMGALETVETEN